MFSEILESIPWYTWVIGGLVLALISAAVWFFVKLNAQNAAIGKLYEFANVVNTAIADPNVSLQGQRASQPQQQQFVPPQQQQFVPQQQQFVPQQPTGNGGSLNGMSPQASPAPAPTVASAVPFDLNAIGGTLMATLKGFMKPGAPAPVAAQDEDAEEDEVEEEEEEEEDFDHQEFDEEESK